MDYSDLILSPGSAEPTSFTLKDANKAPIDFTIGIWSAYLTIVQYPGYSGLAFHITGTPGYTPSDSNWLTFGTSKIVFTPDPAVTMAWAAIFTRYHFDCYLKGPNANSKPILIAHGSCILDP